MWKIGIIVLLSLWAEEYSAQSWYNTTQTFDPQYSLISSVSEIDDSLYVFGKKPTLSQNGFYQQFLRISNPLTGSIYREVILTDTIGQVGAVIDEHIFHKNNFYVLHGRILDFDTVTSQLQKLDRFGNLLWSKRYNFTNLFATFRSITALNDTTLLLCGEKETSFGNLDIRLLWLDTNGNVLNERVYNAPQNEYGYMTEQFSNGDLLIAGTRQLVNPNNVGLVYRLNSGGDIIWQKNIGGIGASGGFINLINDTSFLFSGFYGTPTEINRPRINKYDGNGNLIWSFTYPDFPGINQVNKNATLWLFENPDLTITAIAQFKDSVAPFVFYYRAVLLNLSKNGELKWSRKIKLRNRDHYLTSFIQAENNDNIFTGYFGADSIGQVQDGWLVRCNCIGLFQGPEDSLQLSQNFNSVSVNNFANHFQYSTITWGDETAEESIESNYSDSLEKIAHTHAYAQAGTYTISQKTIACNDTLTNLFSVIIAFTPNSFNSLAVFPNPNNGNFSMGLTHSDEAIVSIYENTGKIVYQEITDLNTGKKFDLTQLSAGMYHVLVEADGNSWNTKIVVE